MAGLNYLEKKKQTETDIKLIEDRIKVLDSQRKQASEGIDPSFLNRYERILKHKDGVAIVPIQGGGSCGGPRSLMRYECFKSWLSVSRVRGFYILRMIFE